MLKLAQDDFDSIIASVQIKSETEVHVSIYPNPASDLIHISTTKEIQEILLIHLNSGIQIRRELTNRTLDISNLSTGVYLLSIKMNNEVIHKRFMKR
jgi:hypothetical protein